jgi:UDP-N-acetylglucosamine--N-acetylmuramyl-(pentapeptide) pyrophosphoryl-undecaprenol N-acetylglucosamine transferase
VNSKKKLVVLTGGGTAGHVMPNLALVPTLESSGYAVQYIGSKGIEENLAVNAGLEFFRISSGKLRRYASWENFIDIFRVLLGVIQSVALMIRLRPNVVFSKGGFVSVPVAIAAKLTGVPVVCHESDYTPGLANRIIAKFAKVLLYSFPETKAYVNPAKSRYVPSPIRSDLFAGQRDQGLSFCGFQKDGAPVLLVMGGSQGAQRLNEALLAALPTIIKQYRVIHLTGKGKAIDFSHPHYKQFEFIGDEIKHIYAATDFVVCRAGANSIFEMLALHKPMLLIPLEVGSRGDQILNAKSFVSKGWAHILMESTLTVDGLIDAVGALANDKSAIMQRQCQVNLREGGRQIVMILEEVMSSQS